MRVNGEKKSMVAKSWHYFVGERPAGEAVLRCDPTATSKWEWNLSDHQSTTNSALTWWEKEESYYCNRIWRTRPTV